MGNPLKHFNSFGQNANKIFRQSIQDTSVRNSGKAGLRASALNARSYTQQIDVSFRLLEGMQNTPKVF